MLGKKVFAAMLATALGASLFGANAAKAQLNLDDNEGAVIYATETLAATVEDYDDYSVVTGDGDDLNVTGVIGLGGPPNSFVTVRFDLTGMVFTETPSLEITQHASPSRRSGGNAGDNFASFIASREGSRDGTEIATLTVGSFGVKPGVNGSVMMTVTDSLGDDAMHTEKYDSAVRTARALQENADPMDLEATVEQRFQSFGDESTGMLGSFIVGTNEDLLNADDGMAVTDDDIFTDADSSVTISGDFSFASMAWLVETGTACDAGTPTDLLQREDETVMDELMEQIPSAFETAQHLCISVPEGDDAVAIPATAPYIVTTEYDAGTAMAGWPPNDGEHSLGSITRDGTTVHIPFLTTWADYNQRIVVSNRGANPAPYWITFRPEDGVMATPGMYATGTLDGNSTMVLRVMDVVTLDGRTRTAATFVAEAKSTQIDVATVIVNMMTGGTDTVNYDSE